MCNCLGADQWDGWERRTINCSQVTFIFTGTARLAHWMFCNGWIHSRRVDGHSWRRVWSPISSPWQWAGTIWGEWAVCHWPLVSAVIKLCALLWLQPTQISSLFFCFVVLFCFLHFYILIFIIFWFAYILYNHLGIFLTILFLNYHCSGHVSIQC